MISSYGTLSCRVDKDSFLINPANKNRRALQIEDFVLIQQNQCEAGKTPSRATQLHQGIYKKHPHITVLSIPNHQIGGFLCHPNQNGHAHHSRVVCNVRGDSNPCLRLTIW